MGNLKALLLINKKVSRFILSLAAKFIRDQLLFPFKPQAMSY